MSAREFPAGAKLRLAPGATDGGTFLANIFSMIQHRDITVATEQIGGNPEILTVRVVPGLGRHTEGSVSNLPASCFELAR